MGIFNKTDEELRIEEENKKWSLLINAIWESTLTDVEKRSLLEYVNSVRKGLPNVFDDVDTLTRVVLELVEGKFDKFEDFNDHFERIREFYFTIKTSVKEQPSLKNYYLKYIVNQDGILYRGLFDKKVYALFQNKEDYFEIMKVVISNLDLEENFDIIKNYILGVSRYCLNQDILKRDIVSYLSRFSLVVDHNYEQYTEECLEEARKRIGVYNIDSKELALANSNVRKMESYFDQFDIFKKQMDRDKSSISTLIVSGRKEIKDETNSSINSLKEMILAEREELLKKLDDYLLDLEKALKNKSDATFREILNTYESQVQKFRDLFQGYSLAASEDLIAIQKATEDSVQKLQDYVTNEPQLKELLDKANQENGVRKKIIQLVNKEEELLKVSGDVKKETVQIPGYERRIMVPYRHLVLPSEINGEVNYFLNEKIPFSKRKDKFYQKLEERQKKGEIFHKKIPQIAIDIMEGDWPYLWGPSGTGKSYMVKQIASLLDMDLTKAGKITEPYSILGYNDPQGRYQITPSFIATLYGHLLFLDEMDNGNPDTQVVLNDIYSELLNKLENPSENCEVTFGTDVRVDVHPNFRMLAAGNTSGEGENEAFSSRGKMDESIQERMTPIYVDYDNRVEERILKDYPVWYKFSIDFRNACMDYSRRVGNDSPQGITTTRDAAAIKKYIEHNSKSVDQVLAEKFIQIKDDEYKKALASIIASKYGISGQKCDNPSYNGSLATASEKVLAKKFIYACQKGER